MGLSHPRLARVQGTGVVGVTATLIGAIVLLLGVVACHDEFKEAADRARLQQMRLRIESLVGKSLCTDSSDCRAIGFGSKSCGGPWEYLVYSAATIDTVKLRELVARYNEFEDEMNRRYGYVSDCSVPNPPVLGCQSGRCVDLVN
jgi:hypothetical protein